MTQRMSDTSKMSLRSIFILWIYVLISGFADRSYAKTRQAVQSKPDPCLSDKECKILYERAHSLSAGKQYNAALSTYQLAFQRNQVPWLLVNIGRMYQLTGNPSEAIKNFDVFLGLPGAEDYPEFVHKASGYRVQAVEDLKNREAQKAPGPGTPLPIPGKAVPPSDSPDVLPPPVLAAVPSAVSLPSVAPAGVSSVPVPTTPLAKDSELVPVVGTGAARKDGGTVSASQRRSVSEMNPQTTLPQDSKIPIYKRWWFWTTLGVVVAAGVAGGIAGGVTAKGGDANQPDPRTMNSMQRTLPMPWFDLFSQ